jgi:hypothetical protein
MTDAIETNRDPDEIAEDMRRALQGVFDSLNGCGSSPTELSRSLDLSRVMVSRTMGALKKQAPSEMLTSIPGPETIRSIVRASRRGGVDEARVDDALRTIDAFDELIRGRYGTRSALNAALSGKNEHAREKFEQSSRYEVYKGMSQIVGAQSKLWLTTMMLVPNKDNPSGIDIHTIHGTSGLRRLRPESPVRFVYGVPPEHVELRQSPQRADGELGSFFRYRPAPLSVLQENGQIINTFEPDTAGKDALYDMFAEVMIPNGSSRYASNGRTMRGTTVIPDIPVITLVSDVILCDDVFDGIEPELFVYNTMPRGGADIHDPKRDVDRIHTDDHIEDLGAGPKHLEISEFPKYTRMVEYLCKKNNRDIHTIRTRRVQIQYPVYGFQYTIAFRVPEQSE